ncbi:MAG: YwiC-like family protein [Ignavibacteria bacterium]|jgi:hypothetical protein|nr:YwiC-like family protein [Ignavibacteria bacterium]MCU7504853.1 YwiC-like family protein [Ignavibacteria bacterium]MCU7518335.1 YwiC-like family protein [Ignavibacteria bacterium]
MKPVVTKEHGSWAVLFIPVLTGIAVSRNYGLPVFLFIASVFFLFMSYTPAEMMLLSYYRRLPHSDRLKTARYWFTVYISLSLLSGIPLIAVYHKYGLLFFAAAALAFFISSLYIMFSLRKNVWSDFLAMAGLTLSAPAAVYLAENAFTSRSLLLYFLNLLFFGSSAFYVHMKMKLSSLKKSKLTFHEKLTVGKLNLLYNAVAIFLLLAFTASFPHKFLIMMAYLPMLIHAITGTFKLPEKVSYKKIGMTFLAYSVVFLLMISLSGM